MSGGEGNHRKGGGGKRSQSGRETRGSVCRRAGGKTIERPEETEGPWWAGRKKGGVGKGLGLRRRELKLRRDRLLAAAMAVFFGLGRSRYLFALEQ